MKLEVRSMNGGIGMGYLFEPYFLFFISYFILHTSNFFSVADGS
jgi:hypothetical protein